MTRRAAALLVAFALVAAASGLAFRPDRPGPMAAAAVKFLDSLTPELRAKAVLAYDGKERLDWHFVPRERPGVMLKELSDPQRASAHGLLRAGLSSTGYLKATGIIELEGILHDIEAASGADASGRDPGRYTLTIYGSPSGGAPWGWKIEGHHLSLNFSSVSNNLVATTPAFMGANPETVGSGPHAGWRVLGAEEDLGFELLGSLDDSQRAEAIIAKDAPADIILGPGRGLDGAPAAGLAASKMSEIQRSVLMHLVEEYADNLHHDMARAQLERIRAAGVEKIRFAWAGATEPAHGHYYRIAGPTFVIELDNTQNNANHVHTVWHDLEHDFGRDLLREHYERDHKDR